MTDLDARVLEYLDAFERQLRYLAGRRKHNGRPGPLSDACGGIPVCVRCSMVRRADQVADDLFTLQRKPSEEAGTLL